MSRLAIALAAPGSVNSTYCPGVSLTALRPDASAGSGLYASFDDVRGLLELAELEKVLYELRYEAANRPAWLHIPLEGLRALLGKKG